MITETAHEAARVFAETNPDYDNPPLGLVFTVLALASAAKLWRARYTHIVARQQAVDAHPSAQDQGIQRIE